MSSRKPVSNGYMDVKQASEKWDINMRRVASLCQHGRVAGAQFQNLRWEIPINAPKPKDKRRVNLEEICKGAEN